MKNKYRYVLSTLFKPGKQRVLNKKVYYEDEVKQGNILVVGEKGLKDSGFSLNSLGVVSKKNSGYFA